MKRPLKWLLTSLAAVFVLVLLTAVTIGFTLGTEAGTRWAIGRIDSVIPGSIGVERFAGTLWGGMQVPVVDYRDEATEIHVVDAELSINWSSVLSGQFELEKVNAKSVVYRNLAARDPAAPIPAAEPFELAFEPLPVAIGLVASRVGSLTLVGGEDDFVVADILLSKVLLNGRSFRADIVSAAVNDYELSVSGLNAEINDDIPLRARIQWASDTSPWAGSGSVRGNLASLEFDHAIDGPYPAAATGQIRLLHRIEPEIDAVLTWEEWSFDGFSLVNGETFVRGTTNNYSGDYDVTLMSSRADQIRIVGSAAGNLERLAQFDARATSQAGNAELTGSLAWQPVFAATAQISASEFDPSPFVEELTGSLDADFGLSIDNDGNFSIADAMVTGVLNDESVSASGSLAITGSQVRCLVCELNVGINRIDIDGLYGRGDDVLTFEISAPALETLWPEFSGSLEGEGELTGAAVNPRFTGQLHGQKLEFDRWSVGEIVIDSRASTIDAFDLSAAVSSFSLGESDIGSFTVSGKGTPESLDMMLAWQFRGLDIDAEASIQQRENGIDGTVTSASVTEPNTGRWSLQDQFQFRVSGSDISLGDHAWTGELGTLRVSRLSSIADDIELVAGIDALPLQFANSFLPENLKLSGSANASIDVNRLGGEWSGSIGWSQAGTVLSMQESSDEWIDVSIPKSEVDVELIGGGANALAAIEIEPGVAANLKVAFAELSSDTSINAELKLGGQDWEWIPALLPSIDNFEGAISATVSATGLLQAPELSGSLNWRDGSLAVPSLNVPVSDIDLTITGSSAGAAAVSGTAKAGGGDLSVSGRVENVMRDTRSVSMRVRGSTAELINWPEYRLWGSPDLVVVGTREGWVFSGSFGIPRAEIAVTDVSDEAVAPSPDVVVVGREESLVEEPTRIDGVARLTFGDEVHVTAFGLDTKLRGDLQVRMFKDRPISAEGTVTLAEGIFAAYGQKLTIQEGTLTFTGPLDDPIVDVRAVRVIEAIDGQVTAGFHLQGRATQITSTVYSEPVMAEADALSYLVVGRPLSQATQSEGGELSSAALALGVRQAGRITEQIGQSLGLDQLTVAGDGGDTTALVAGKQINPRLHARYAYGVFSRLGTLLLRYRLSKRLTLEAGAGEAQSIDLLYLVEKE